MFYTKYALKLLIKYCFMNCLNTICSNYQSNVLESDKTLDLHYQCYF